MSYGAITNEKIDRITVTGENLNISIEAKIIKSGDNRIWYAQIDNLTGSRFSIKVYSKDGKILSETAYDAPFSMATVKLNWLKYKGR